MRLWSLHPQYLDAKGLVAAWREGLLARKVLQGKTRGYRNHPQLLRFRAQKNPVAALDVYLSALWDEAVARGYSFDRSKIRYRKISRPSISVTRGQAEYEWKHLLRKLKVRDPERYRKIRATKRPRLAPVFRSRPGGVESWEKI